MVRGKRMSIKNNIYCSCNCIIIEGYERGKMIHRDIVHDRFCDCRKPVKK